MGDRSPVCLTLASGSEGRRYLLERAGYTFEVRPSGVDEPNDAGFPSPRHLVQYVAWLKAAAVAHTLEASASGLILAADTISWIEGQPIGKPVDAADARRILHLLSGRDHELWTGVVLWRRPDDVQFVFQERSVVRFAPLDATEIERYLVTRSWQGHSGGYAIKEEGDPYVQVVEGTISNVIGLPMETLERVLKSFSPEYLPLPKKD